MTYWAQPRQGARPSSGFAPARPRATASRDAYGATDGGLDVHSTRWPASSRCSARPAPAAATTPTCRRSRSVADRRHAGGGRSTAAPPPPRLDQGPDAVGRQLPRAQGPAPRPEPQHGLRGGPLPEHRGVLGPAHRDDHDPRRHLHPGLRVLRGQDRPADLVRRRRAAPRRRGGRRAAASSTWSSPASPATTCPTAARGSSPRRSARMRETSPGMGIEVLIPDFDGADDAAADRHGRPARHPQPQPRDRAAAPEAGPQARPLGSQPVRPAPGQGDGRRDRLPGPHEAAPDGRPGRDARRADRGVRGAARGRRRHPDRSASTCGRRCSTCRSSATTTPTSSPR